MVKRIFDIILSLVLLFLLLPILLVVSLAIRFFIGRPIFFYQERPGLHGVSFRMIKFRTMSDERDEKGVLLPDINRLTKFGKFLRATSLDELPELINVLTGGMSFVGPRPLLMEYLPLYNEEQSKRHNIRPGITGWAQVNGRNAISWEQKFEYDVWYVENQSLWLDVKILILTIKSVFICKGINAEGHVTMHKFSGSK